MKDDNNEQFVFLNKTWIFFREAKKRLWHDKNIRTVKSEGLTEPFIIVMDNAQYHIKCKTNFAWKKVNK